LRLVAETESAASTSGSSAGGVQGGDPGASGPLSAEQVEQYRLENRELKGKLADLSDQVDTTERVLTLKDDQIAALQARMAELEKQLARAAEGQAVEMPPALVEPTLADASAADTEATSGDAEAPVDYNFADADTLAGDDSPDSMAVDAADDGFAGSDSEPSPLPVAADEPVAQPIVVEDVRQEVLVDESAKTSTPEPEADLMTQILNNPLYLALAGGGLVVIVVLLLIAARRRREEEDDEFEEELPQNLAIPDDVDRDDIADDFDEEPFTATADEPDEEAVQQTADVIGEAEIYVAYGRFAQAIEMLENAATNEPGRADIHYKLLEVAVEANEPDTFAAHYQELKALRDTTYHDRADALRDKMGWFDTQDANVADDLADFDLDEDQDELPDTPQRGHLDDDDFTTASVDTQHKSSDVAGLDFSLDMDLDDGDATLVAPKRDDNSLDFVSSTSSAAEVDDHTLEFDAGLVGADVKEDQGVALDFDVADTEGSAGESALELDLDALDSDEVGDSTLAFDSAAQSRSQPSDMIASDRAAELANELEFETDFSLDDDAIETAAEFSLDETSDLVPADSFASADDAVLDQADLDEVGLDGSDLAGQNADLTDNLDLGSVPAFAPIGGRAANEDEELDFLSDADEASTKLDLARAYIDMGDREGAKDILDEVLVEGNTKQQQEAKELLAKLG
jgi:pilus assembly protein FimV